MLVLQQQQEQQRLLEDQEKQNRSLLEHLTQQPKLGGEWAPAFQQQSQAGVETLHQNQQQLLRQQEEEESQQVLRRQEEELEAMHEKLLRKQEQELNLLEQQQKVLQKRSDLEQLLRTRHQPPSLQQMQRQRPQEQREQQQQQAQRTPDPQRRHFGIGVQGDDRPSVQVPSHPSAAASKPQMAARGQKRARMTEPEPPEARPAKFGAVIAEQESRPSVSSAVSPAAVHTPESLAPKAAEQKPTGASPLEGQGVPAAQQAPPSTSSIEANLEVRVADSDARHPFLHDESAAGRSAPATRSGAEMRTGEGGALSPPQVGADTESGLQADPSVEVKQPHLVKRRSARLQPEKTSAEAEMADVSAVGAALAAPATRQSSQARPAGVADTLQEPRKRVTPGIAARTEAQAKFEQARKETQHTARTLQSQEEAQRAHDRAVAEQRAALTSAQQRRQRSEKAMGESQKEQ
eukprot:gene20110-24074_t